MKRKYIKTFKKRRKNCFVNVFLSSLCELNFGAMRDSWKLATILTLVSLAQDGLSSDKISELKRI